MNNPIIVHSTKFISQHHDYNFGEVDRWHLIQCDLKGDLLANRLHICHLVQRYICKTF
jgi:hypothetical protein